MTELLTAAQMRAIEAAAIASGQVTGLELMERAGRGVVEAVLAEWPELALAPHRAVVLCGPGNNGGDGFVVARLLKERGWAVEVFLYGEEEKLPPDAKANCERWRGMGEVRPLAKRSGSDVNLFVDALFGTGLTRELPKEAHEFAVHFFDTRERTCFVSVDVLSGVCADSGRVIGSEPLLPWAELTVTFHRPRVGHYLGAGSSYSGDLRCADIGLEGGLRDHPNRGVLLAAPLRPRLRKSRNNHKYTHGHALILSGPATRTGGARLAARGALRIGAGVVTVGAPGAALAEHAARLDAVMLREVGDGAALASTLEDKRINALCLGPGLGLDARAAGLVGAALASRAEARPTQDPVGRVSARLATVLDADALTLLSRDPALFAALHQNCILTPHAGEFARLFRDIAAKLAEPATKGPAYSKVDATREAAARAGCVVLYKGPDTVIADPSGRAAINSAHYDRAAPWLATAGSGDVLAGFITGLLARGFAPFDAACAAAWLHVECARVFGPGLIAEDLAEMLPKVFRDLGL
jgi:hydroxyethylthiazole kinase-like uncharacterized protein yjeF